MAIKHYTRHVDRKKGAVGHVPYSPKQRFQAVVTYLATGNMAVTAEIVDIPPERLRGWKMEPWWKEMEDEVRQQKRVEVSGKLGKIIDKAFKVVEDRLENGDYIYNTKTGGIRRVEVNAKTAGDILHKSIDRQVLLDKITIIPEAKEEQVMDRLKSIELRLIEAAKIRPLPKLIEADVITIEE